MPRIKHLSKAAQLERQKQIAREAGLIPEIEPSFFKHDKRKKPVPEQYKPKFPAPVEIAQPESHPCPCQQAGITEGRVKLATGWCLEGKFMSFGELHNWRTLKHYSKSEEGFNTMKKAIDSAKDILGFDMENARIYPVTPPMKRS